MEIIFAFVIIALFLAAFQLTLEWASDNFFYYTCCAFKKIKNLIKGSGINE